jgi:3-ketosteroid 9alpha-monooxygenase subunit A
VKPPSPRRQRRDAGRRRRGCLCGRTTTIYLWHNTDGGEPGWDVPDAFADMGEHIATRTFRRGAVNHFTQLQVHPQMFAENAVDPRSTSDSFTAPESARQSLHSRWTATRG